MRLVQHLSEVCSIACAPVFVTKRIAESAVWVSHENLMPTRRNLAAGTENVQNEASSLQSSDGCDERIFCDRWGATSDMWVVTHSAAK